MTSIDAPRLQSGQPGTQLEDRIRASYSRIMGICLCAGLSPSDAEDVAQDIWEWLLRTRNVALAEKFPWLGGVAQNFVLRYRRRKYRHDVRESHPLTGAAEPQAADLLPALEVNELLDRTATHLPQTERKILALIRSGHSLAEAARLLAIPRGSRSYYHGRLIACARNELRSRTPIPIERGASPDATAQPRLEKRHPVLPRNACETNRPTARPTYVAPGIGRRRPQPEGSPR